MGDLLRRFYHKIRPILIRLGPSNPLMRGSASLLFNQMGRDHQTKIHFTSKTIDIIKSNKILRLSSRHWIYTMTLSKAFDTYYSCVTPATENNFQLVDYSRPHLQRFKLSGLEFEVASFPEEEETIIDYFRWYKPHLGDVVFDLGANCGLSVYYLSKAVGPDGKVFAFEPDPENYDVLLRNIDRHSLSNVIPLRKALASKAGNLEFYSEGTIGSSLAKQSNRGTTGNTITVEAISLIDAFNTYGIPSFIKMDIEGAEIEVISASIEFLSKHSIHFAIDTNHWKNGKLTYHEVEMLFLKCGYEVLSSSESGCFTTWARFIT